MNNESLFKRFSIGERKPDSENRGTRDVPRVTKLRAAGPNKKRTNYYQSKKFKKAYAQNIQAQTDIARQIREHI